MIWRQRKDGPVPMDDRWRKVFRASQIRLDPFSRAELDAVTFDPECLPGNARGNAVQDGAPLLAALAEYRDGFTDGLVAAPSPQAPATDPGALAAADRLEVRGYISPGEPDPVKGGAIPREHAGWIASPGWAAPRRVAIAGDLAIIARIRSQPFCVAEAAVSAEPTRADPVAATWTLVARMHAARSPKVCLVEAPPAPGSQAASFTLLTEESALGAVMGWCGVDTQELLHSGQRRSHAERHAAAAQWPPGVPTAELAGGFASVGRLTVAHPDRGQVMLQRITVARSRDDPRQRWILTGEYAERAAPATIDQIGERVVALFRLAEFAGDDS